MKCDLGISLDGPDLVAIGHAIFKSRWMEAFQHPPDDISLDDDEAEVDEHWLTRFLAPSKYGTSVIWREPKRFFALDWGLMLKFNVDAIDSDEVLPIMAEWPFDVATITSLHSSWYRPTLENRYHGPSFGNGHANLGWACLLRGEEGHRRLVSRRWLDFGPWRVLRGPNDTTMVQFHDVHADALTALEQAKLGHQMMANTKHGGIINPLFRIRNKFSGFHSREPPHVRIICHAGRKVTPSEMLDACTVRFHNNISLERFAVHRDGQARVFGHRDLERFDGPVDSVAFIFITEEDARAHLHELWLRELECWTFINGKEVRLDLDYHPEPPEKPDWVKALDG